MQPDPAQSKPGTFIVEHDPLDKKFPYRVRIESLSGKLVIRVRCRHPWPGANTQLFCLRDDGTRIGYVELERVHVIGWFKVGNRLTFSLDRPTRKRAEFLKVPKGSGPNGDDENVFFRTQGAIEAHKSRGAPVLYGKHDISVVIDSAEKYPWTFGADSAVTRRKLQAGDYAAVVDEAIVAVVERKAFQDFITSLYSISTLHQKLAELSAYQSAAVLVEGQYADLLNPKKIGLRCKPAHLARLVAELAVLHPKVPVVWCGSRKDANTYAVNLFEAATRKARHVVLDSVAETPDMFEGTTYAGGVDQSLRADFLHRAAAAAGTSFKELAAIHDTVAGPRIQRVLKQLRDEGELTTTGKARATRWHKTIPLGPSPSPARRTSTPTESLELV